MPDLERWLSDVEGRHVGYDHETWMGKECACCDGPWPCDAAQAARVIREYQRNLSRTISEAIPLHECYQDALNTQQRIAAIIEGRGSSE